MVIAQEVLKVRVIVYTEKYIVFCNLVAFIALKLYTIPEYEFNLYWKNII